MSALVRTVSAFLAAAFVGPAFAAEAPATPLQFSDIGKVTEWKAGGEATVYVKDANGQWYKADLAETCMSLDTSGGVRFITSANPLTQARESKVTVGRHICTVIELAKVAGAPPEAKKTK